MIDKLNELDTYQNKLTRIGHYLTKLVYLEKII